MNWSYNPEKQHPAFLDGKPNPHSHWHIIPRYDSPRQFGIEAFDHYRCKKLDFETQIVKKFCNTTKIDF